MPVGEELQKVIVIHAFLAPNLSRAHGPGEKRQEKNRSDADLGRRPSEPEPRARAEFAPTPRFKLDKQRTKKEIRLLVKNDIHAESVLANNFVIQVFV